MRTTDLFNFNRSSKRLNESLQKTFGTKINFESFDTPKLEDARNKLRTQIHTARNQSGFNETIENEALTKAQFMHDAIVAELMDRQEHIVDTTVEEAPEDRTSYQVARILADNGMSYDSNNEDEIIDAIGMILVKELDMSPGQARAMMNDEDFLGDTLGELQSMEDQDDEGGDTDDGYALASAGFGSDEDYGDFPESMENSQYVVWYMVDDGEWDEQGTFDDEASAYAYIEQLAAKGYDDDNFEVLTPGQHPDDDYDYKTPEAMEERVRDPEDWDEGNTEPPNNFAIYINGKKWKVFKGRGRYADDAKEMAHYQQLKDLCAKKSESTGKKWSVSVTGENPTESIETESAPPTAKGERMVKHIKKGYADDGKLTDKEKSIAYATAWKAHNKNESIEQTGDDMRNLREGEIQQASAIVTAKTMVDRVGRWIEELSGMENETLLQLGDSIRDEMGQEQAKAFIEAVAPAIQAALDNLKQTRDTLSTGVRSLASGEQPDTMLGAEPAIGDEGGMDMAEPDMMNDAEIGGEEDAFAAAEPGAGGMETTGREQRESIDRQSRLMKILAG